MLPSPGSHTTPVPAQQPFCAFSSTTLLPSLRTLLTLTPPSSPVAPPLTLCLSSCLSVGPCTLFFAGFPGFRASARAKSHTFAHSVYALPNGFHPLPTTALFSVKRTAPQICHSLSVSNRFCFSLHFHAAGAFLRFLCSTSAVTPMRCQYYTCCCASRVAAANLVPPRTPALRHTALFASQKLSCASPPVWLSMPPPQRRCLSSALSLSFGGGVVLPSSPFGRHVFALAFRIEDGYYEALMSTSDHTSVKAPDPIRTPKLNTLRPR